MALKQHICVVQIYMCFTANDTYLVPLSTWVVAHELSEHLLELVADLLSSETAEHPAFIEFIKMLIDSRLDTLYYYSDLDMHARQED